MSTDLPVNIDATYPDRSAGDTAHQQHHDGLHGVHNARLIVWASAGAFTSETITLDVDNVPSSANVVWPDGSAGVWTRTAKNATWLTVDAYTVTHAASGVTVTQPAVTRNADGHVTDRPALTIA